MTDTTWAEWTDPLGQVYRPGDLVAIATVRSRSPQQVIARVVQINRCDSNGRPHMEHRYEAGRNVVYPSCTVRCEPLISGRSFGRYSNKSVTYSIPGNIVKLSDDALDARREGQVEVAKQLIEDLAEP